MPMKISGICIEIRTMKFPILPDEDEEIINDGMYGKALCLYLEDQLPRIGLKAQPGIAEDWGWWIEVEENEFILGLQIYSNINDQGQPDRYAIMSTKNDRMICSWSKFRKIDISANVLSVMSKPESLFSKYTEILSIKRHDEFPF